MLASKKLLVNASLGPADVSCPGIIAFTFGAAAADDREPEREYVGGGGSEQPGTQSLASHVWPGFPELLHSSFPCRLAVVQDFPRQFG